MLTSSPTSPIGSRPASTATTAPVEIVAMWGVRSVGWISAATGGSRPSCAIARKIRGCASSITRMTEVRPKTIPSLMNGESQPTPAASIPTAIGSGTFNLSNGTMPVSTRLTTTYSTVQITSEPRIPIGISRIGLFASCAAVETASNPI